MNRKHSVLYVMLIFLLFLPITCLPGDTLVQRSHLLNIESLFKKNGLIEASVRIDRFGRVELVGSYFDRKAVDLAFSLAQTVVGVKWVSPVTPENIKIKEWEKKISSFFPTKKGAPGQPSHNPSLETGPPRTYESTDRQPEHIDQGRSVRPPGEVAAKYAVVMGVSKFKERITPLAFAQNDADAVYQYLVSPSGGRFKRENVSLLVNEEATRSNIVNALQKIGTRATKDDLVIIFFSSHGTPPAPFGGVYIATYDSIVNPKQMIWETSITNDILREFITGLRAQRLLIIMDACYSNGAYSRIDGFLPTGGKSLGMDDDEGYGRSQLFMADKLLGSKDIILDDEPTKLPTQSRSGYGKVLVSSSDEAEQSWESDTLKSSFFTYYFLEGLKLHGSVRESFDYAKPKVIAGVLKEKQKNQHPQVAADRKDWDIRLTQ